MVNRLTSVGGVLDCCHQWRVDRVKGDGEGAVDDATIDLSTKVQFTHVIIAKHRVVAGVGCVVSGTVVETAPGGERQPWTCERERERERERGREREGRREGERESEGVSG